MALSAHTTAILKALARGGDSFARHARGIATRRDYMLLLSLAKRGDKLAQRHMYGTAGETNSVKALVDRLALKGDVIAKGLDELTTERATQTITFNAPATASLAAGAITLTATASSGLPVTFTLVSGDATLVGAVLTPTAATGSVVVEASQAGDLNYLAATTVSDTITLTA